MAQDEILITGVAGFIGFHVARRLLQAGRTIVGIDNMSAYYDPALKQARCAELAKSAQFQFHRLDVADRAGMARLFEQHRFRQVVHLAAQAGVRHSLVEPQAYVDANSGRLRQRAGRLPARRLRPSAVRVVVVGLWRQQQAAVPRPPTMSIVRSTSTAPRRKPTS